MSKPSAIEVTGDVLTFARNNRMRTKRQATIERAKASGLQRERLAVRSQASHTGRSHLPHDSSPDSSPRSKTTRGVSLQVNPALTPRPDPLLRSHPVGGGRVRRDG